MMKKWKIILAVSILVLLPSIFALAEMTCSDLRRCSGKVTCHAKAGVIGCIIDCGDTEENTIPFFCNEASGPDPTNMM